MRLCNASYANFRDQLSANELCVIRRRCMKNACSVVLDRMHVVVVVVVFVMSCLRCFANIVCVCLCENVSLCCAAMLASQLGMCVWCVCDCVCVEHRRRKRGRGEGYETFRGASWESNARNAMIYTQHHHRVNVIEYMYMAHSTQPN